MSARLRTVELELTPAVANVLFGLWAVAAIAATAARRGELLEMALIGTAGALAWPLVAGMRVTFTRGALLATCFVAPVLNAWPFRVYDAKRVSFGIGVVAVAAVPSLLVLIAAAAHTGWRRRVPSLLLGAAGLFLLGGITSTIVAHAHADSAAQTWLVFVIAPLFAVLLVQSVGRADVGRYLGVTAIAAGVPATVGVAAYILELGFPTNAGAIELGKRLLYRPHFFQDVTMGNVGHIVDFSLLLLGPAVAVALVSRNVLVRVASAAVAVGLAGLLVLSASRSGLVTAVIVAVVLTVLVAPIRRVGAALPAVVAVILLVVLLSGPVRQSVATLVPVGSSAPTQTTPHPGHPTPASQSSEQIRIDAIRTAWHVFEHHAPWGVGTGQYLAYDPVHTAAHSLALQVLSEIGVFGLAGLIVFIVFVLVSGLGILRHRRGPPDGYLLGIGCAAGLCGYLLNGLGAGSLLALGPVLLWALVLWELAAVLALEAE
jgi:hypothetical protein